jgi:membrane protein
MPARAGAAIIARIAPGRPQHRSPFPARHVERVRRELAPYLERLAEVEFVDRSVAIASQAFVALIPLLLVSSALLPRSERHTYSDSIVRRFDLHGSSASQVRQVFAQPAEVRNTLSVIGVLVLVVSALSFCRVLQRVYERAWRLPPLGIRGTPGQLAWLGMAVVYLVVAGALNTSLGRWLGSFGSVVVALSCGVVLWLWTPFLLLGRRVERRRLRITAVLTALSLSLTSLWSVLYMPQAIGASAARFGAIGIAMALLSWLIALAFVVVGATVIAAVWAERSAPAPAARAEAAASTRTAGRRRSPPRQRPPARPPG